MGVHVKRQRKRSVAAGYLRVRKVALLVAPQEGGSRLTGAPNPRHYLGAVGGLGFVVMFMLEAIVSNVAATTAYPRRDADAAEAQAYVAETSVWRASYR